MTIRYAGKAYAEKAHIVKAEKLVEALNIPTMNGQPDSVSGCFHAFVKVGIEAIPSLAIANVIATFGSLVTYQRIMASPDNTPQTQSNDVSVQCALFEMNEAVNIRRGERPDMNTGKAAQPTPLDVAAAVAMKGAIDHISQDTLFGFAPPLNIERT